MVAFVVIGGIGFLMLALTWLMGELFDLGHEVASFLGGHDGGLDAHGPDAGPSPFSSRVIFTFMTAFGGGGAIASLYDRSTLLSAFIGLAAGLVMGGATWAFARAIHLQQASSGLEMNTLVGKSARVVVGIPTGGVGQVSVTAGGGSSTFLARSPGGNAVPNGTLVRVTEIQGDVVIVDASETISHS